MKIQMTALLDSHGPTAGKTHFLALCRHFADRGHPIFVQLPKSDDWQEIERELRKRGMVTHWTHPLASPIQEWMWWGWWRTICLMVALVRNKPDALYIRCRTSCPFLTAAARLVSRRLKIVSEHAGWVAHQLKVCQQSTWKQYLASWSQLQNARWASKCRVVSEGIADILAAKGIPRDRIFVVGNGTDTSLFRPMPRKEAFARTGLDPDCTYIGFAGRLERWQGVDILIRALFPYVSSRPATRLLIVGDGPVQEDLRAYALACGVADQCLFTGQVPHEQMPDYINCFSVSILFKYGLDEIADGLYASLKLRDYAACGVPIVGSRNTSDHRIVEDAEIGVLVELDDAAAIAKAVVALLEDPSLGREMGARGRQLAVRQFGWERVADQILAEIGSA